MLMSGDKLVQGQNSDLSFEEVGEDAVAPVLLVVNEPNDCLWIWVLRCDCCGECNCRGVDGWRDSMTEASVVLALDTAAVLLVLHGGIAVCGPVPLLLHWWCGVSGGSGC